MNARATSPECVAEAAAYPEYTRAERAADACIHALGVVGSFAACIALMVIAAPQQDLATLTCLAIYGVGTVMVFCVSAAYHLSAPSNWKSVLRRLDHAAIFVKIAGTYTPFAAISIGGVWGAALMGTAWSIAAIGVPLKLWAPAWLERSAVWLYLAQGWLIMFAIGPASDALAGETLALIAAGGGLYTIGVVFFLSEKLRFHNVIWHGFVLAASGCMYAAVLTGVAFAPEAAAEILSAPRP